MKQDSEMLIREFPKNDDLKIYPVGDLHIGAPEFNVREWDAFKKQLMSEPNSYITIGGDMMNNGLKSSVTNVYEETMRPADQKKWVARELEPIRDKILCVIPGNHENRSGKDADDSPLYDVCAKLDIEDLFRPNMAIVKLRIGDKDGCGSRNPTYTLAVHHGTGGGIYTGATVNRNERFSYYFDGVDIMIVGHAHKGAVTRPEKIVVDHANNKIRKESVIVIGSTSWLEYGGYALRKMLQPSSTGIQTLYLYGDHKQAEVRW